MINKWVIGDTTMMVVIIREVQSIDAPVRAQTRHDNTVSVVVARRLGLLLDGWPC